MVLLLSGWPFDLADVEKSHNNLLVIRFRRTGADLVQEVLLECYLGDMHPTSARSPIDVARRILRYSNERYAGIAEIREADCIPCGFVCRLLAANELTDVERRCRHHRLDHVTGLGYADGDGGLFKGRNGDADADSEHIAEFGIALMLVDDNKAARIRQAFDPAQRRGCRGMPGSSSRI